MPDEPMFKLTGEITESGLCSVNGRTPSGGPVQGEYVFGLLGAVVNFVSLKTGLTMDQIFVQIKEQMKGGAVIDPGKASLWKN